MYRCVNLSSLHPSNGYYRRSLHINISTFQRHLMFPSLCRDSNPVQSSSATFHTAEFILVNAHVKQNTLLPVEKWGGVWSYSREEKSLQPAGGSVKCGILLVRTVLLETPPSYDMKEARGPESDSPNVMCWSVCHL